MSVDLHDLHPAARRLVIKAMRSGWTASNFACRSGKRQIGVLLTSDAHPEQRLRIYPIRQWRASKLATLSNKIDTYGRRNA